MAAIVMTLLVWHELQRVPATAYGDAHYGRGKYAIKVCKDPNVELRRLGKKKALIYHFAGNSGGGGCD